jgi:hypothetical protein
VFQCPYSLGSARHRTFSTVKKCSASKTCGHPPPCDPNLASMPGTPATCAPNPARSSS